MSMNAYVIKGSLGDYYLSRIDEGMFGGYPVWEDIGKAKEFLTYSEAHRVSKELQLEYCSIKKVGLTIKCRPGHIK